MICLLDLAFYAKMAYNLEQMTMLTVCRTKVTEGCSRAVRRGFIGKMVQNVSK